MTRYMLCALLAITSLTFQGIAAAEPAPAALPEIVAEVNGYTISRQDYYNRMERMPAGQGQSQPVETGLLVLRDLINEALLVQLAEQEKCAPTDAQINERYAEMQKAPQFTAKVKEAGMTDDQAKDLVRILQAHFNLMTRGITVSPKEIIDYYNKHQKDQFTLPRHAEVAAIFLEKKADADKAMALLKKGAEFATVAKQLSSDPITRERDGRLARPIYYGDPVLPEHVWKKVLETKEGQYTEPLADQSGSVIFKVIRHNPKRITRLGEVRYQIWENLMREKGVQKRNMDEELSKFREKAEIKIMIERYRDKLIPEAGGPGIPPLMVQPSVGG